MQKETAIKLFESVHVRSVWSNEEEEWYFSIVDVVEALTGSSVPKRYWSDLKNKLAKEGSQLYEKIVQLKLESKDGKRYATDCLDTQNLLRLIQSIPSPKAEPLKMWLAKVGYERIEETEDPETGIDRLMETYLKKGYSTAWINQRLKSIEVRKELTDEWENRNVKQGQEFAILTDEITKAWAGKTVKEYKNLKGLKKENLRDNMTNLELVLNMLAEATTTEISKEKKPESFEQNKTIAQEGGTIAGNTRKAIEEKSGKKIVTGQNAQTLKAGIKNKKLK